MIKIFLLYLSLSITLFAHQDAMRIEIIKTIIKNLDIHQQKVIYSDDKNLRNKLSLIYRTSDNCLESNFIILKDKNNLPSGCENKNIFVLNYNLLYDIPQSFGAFFFKKGRANIILLESKLKLHNIVSTQQLEPYLEEKLW